MSKRYTLFFVLTVLVVIIYTFVFPPKRREVPDIRPVETEETQDVPLPRVPVGEPAEMRTVLTNVGPAGFNATAVLRIRSYVTKKVAKEMKI